MNSGSKISDETPLLTQEQQGEEWDDALDEFDGPRKCSLPPNHGLVDLLLACPYPFEVPPRSKAGIRTIDFGDDNMANSP